MSDNFDTRPAAIAGTKELSLAEQALLAEIDRLADELHKLTLAMETRSDVAKRDLAVARTKLQSGFMWLRRAVTKSERF